MKQNAELVEPCGKGESNTTAISVLFCKMASDKKRLFRWNCGTTVHAGSFYLRSQQGVIRGNEGLLDIWLISFTYIIKLANTCINEE